MLPNFCIDYFSLVFNWFYGLVSEKVRAVILHNLLSNFVIIRWDRYFKILFLHEIWHQSLLSTTANSEYNIEPWPRKKMWHSYSHMIRHCQITNTRVASEGSRHVKAETLTGAKQMQAIKCRSKVKIRQITWLFKMYHKGSQL